MTIEYVQRLLRRTGLRPQIAAGQNFLLDESVVTSMIAAADITSKDKVLEIGAGLGILTSGLAATRAKIVAVELDQRLAEFLRHKFTKHTTISVLAADIFKVNLPSLFSDHGYKVIANLPYGATSLVFRNFLTLPPRPISMT